MQVSERLSSRALSRTAARSEADSGEAMFRALLESAPDAMVIVDADGHISLVNRQAELLFGYDRAALLGQPVEVLVPNRFRSGHHGHRVRYADQPVVRPMGAGAELFGLRADDTEFPVEISLSPIQTAAGTLTAAAIRDVSERRATEARLTRALEAERLVIDQLREVDHLKDEFLSIVSHELRTPLTAIAGFAEILLTPGALTDEDRRVQLIARIGANATDMEWMVEQLLDYSRLQAGRVELDPAPAALETLIVECLNDIEHALSKHELVVDVTPGLVVRADPRGFSRILSNLLTNAAKFAPAGTTITVGARPEDHHARIWVSDQGPGIAAEDRERVFERFYKVAGGSGTRGTGIGLSIAERYVALHGGEINLESTPGEGTTFWFTLPLAARE